MLTPRVAVIGAGSWGTTVASMTAANVPTVLWARREELARQIDEHHENPDYLEGAELHSELRATHSLEEAVSQSDVLLVAVPTHGFRDVLGELAPHLRPWVPVVSLSKGFEQGTRKRMTEIIEEVLPGHPAGVLAGPNLAREIQDGYAAAAVVAMPDHSVAQRLQDILHTGTFRVYSGSDVVGVEIAGALKNVLAIAAGMADGLGTGDNTRALVIARGIAEVSRLGEAMGGDPMTFAGLAGTGDIMATCISPLSRNRTVGVEIAKGRSVDEITDEMNMVAEGVKAARTAMELSEEYDVEMPIAAEVDAVVNEGRTAQEAFRGLLRIEPGHERESG
jgi:glycerol-3-phosphate dehydrogenase (NAD(P)+)